MRTRRTLLGRAMGVTAIVALSSACNGPYVDPPAPREVRAHPIGTWPRLALEPAYRRLYAQLERCVGSSYRVQPRFDRDAGTARVQLVTGLGLNRLSALGNLLDARVDVTRNGRGVAVSLLVADPNLDWLQNAVVRWLDGATDCAR